MTTNTTNMDNLSDWAIPAKRVETITSASRATKRTQGEFLRGPIPLPWLMTASQIGDVAALQVALALWWERGRKNSPHVHLTNATLSRFMDTHDRRKKTRGIKALEAAGLISVERQDRKNPNITIIELNHE